MPDVRVCRPGLNAHVCCSYDPKLLKPQFHGSEVTMHLFEKTVELARHSSQREYFPPMQLMLDLKARNGGKLNSHLWFFTAICRQLRPEFVAVRERNPRSRRLGG